MELRDISARIAFATTLLLAGACAAPATEPSVLALPGTNKSLDEFNTDNLDCRRRAVAPPGSVSASWTDEQRRYDFAYIQCMYAKGHRVPVPGLFTGAPPGSGPPPPPPGKPEPQPQ